MLKIRIKVAFGIVALAAMIAIIMPKMVLAEFDPKNPPTSCSFNGGTCVLTQCDKNTSFCSAGQKPCGDAEEVGTMCGAYKGEYYACCKGGTGGGGGQKSGTSGGSSAVAGGTADGATDGGSGAAVASPSGGIAQMPCEADGECGVQDIVNKGISFAKFIMGLSGAMFLLVFVYGGGMYVMSFGKSSWVDKGKKAMIQACIGIVLVMGAWTVVFYVSKSIGYKAPAVGTSTGEKGGSKGICGQATGTEGRTCMDVKKEGKGKDCVQSYCAGAANIQCCK